MKILKISILFVAVLGVIVLIFGTDFLKEIGSDDPAKSSEYKFIQSSVEKEWNNSTDWDESIFKENHVLINQSKLRDYDKNTLIEHNCSRAISRIDTLIFEEWEKPNCNDNVIKHYIAATGEITEVNSETRNHETFKKIMSVYETYNTVNKFISEAIGLTPEFKPAEMEWNKFKKYRETIENKLNSINNNSNYTTYLSNITKFKNGLNDIPNRLDKAQNNFYTQLGNNIINYFSTQLSQTNDIDVLTQLQRSLNNCREKYKSESGKTLDTKKLNTSYEIKIDQLKNPRSDI